MKREIEEIVLIGGSGFSLEVYSFIISLNLFKVRGYVDLEQSSKLNIPYLGTDEKLNCLFKDKVFNAFLCVGAPNLRKKIYEKIKNIGFNFPSIIHPSSYVSPLAKVSLMGSIIYPNVTINAGVIIEDFVLINSNSSIGHESTILSFVNINPGVHIAGSVKVKEQSLIGINSCIKEKIEIGKNSLIGAGSTVLRSIGDNELHYGSPAKFIKKV